MSRDKCLILSGIINCVTIVFKSLHCSKSLCLYRCLCLFIMAALWSNLVPLCLSLCLSFCLGQQIHQNSSLNFLTTIFKTIDKFSWSTILFISVSCLFMSVCVCFCLFVGHVMSPHPSAQLSERSAVSMTALRCSEVWRRWYQRMTHWLTQSLTRSPIELSWTAKKIFSKSAN